MATSISGNGKAVLIILDGFGIGKDSPFNAINNAKMPFYRDLLAKYPHSQLITHGEAVGLPAGIMGNSEVGHMTMGAGRIIYQDLSRISRAIAIKEFFSNSVLVDTLQAGAKKTGRVHLMGLLSDGGVHSTMEHLLALLDLATQLKIPNVSVHAFLDGRDTPPGSAPKYLQQLGRHPAFSDASGASTKAVLASISGRYYAMDRDKRWERVEKAYKVLTGQAPSIPDSKDKPAGSIALALEALEKSYAAEKTDEFVEPTLLAPEAAMKTGDSVVFFNFRSDRAREISEAMTANEFSGFDRGAARFIPSAYAGMTTYDKNLTGVRVAFGPQNLNHIFGEWLEQRNLTQFRIAETEKYAHVTFFFNGGREKAFAGEERILIPSPKDVATYDLKPEMSALQVAGAAAQNIRSGKFSFVLMNFANADMIGHTGNYEAAVKAMETLDRCLGEVVGAAQSSGYDVLITADHGNAEEMRDEHGKIHTQHTLNPVPAIWVAPNTAIAPKSARVPLRDGTLADIMPTLCAIMGLDVPAEVTGKCLLPN